MIKILNVAEAALDELSHGALSKTSPLKPKSITPELLDTLTEFLSEAMRTVTDQTLLQRLSSTMTKYANVRGEFRYKVMNQDSISCSSDVFYGRLQQCLRSDQQASTG